MVTGTIGPLQIRPLERRDCKGGFSCGVPALDAYLPNFAWQHEQRGIARVYVLERVGGESGVLGFYTLSAKSVRKADIQEAVTHSLPTFDIPVFYIGSFAVSSSAKRQGYGRQLLGDALYRCVQGAEAVGAHGVYLDSLSDESTSFYRSIGFVAIGSAKTPQPMYLPMTTLRMA